ncbi:glycosyl hydrolase family 28-related protein [Natrialbaceae archaeon A-gly3]
MNRRGYLAGVGVLAPSIAGCADGEFGNESDDERPSADAVDPDDSGFDTQRWGYVDVVEWGADPTGSENVTPILEEIVDEEGENGLLVFPPGTYLMEEGLSHANFEHFGLVGQDADDPSATGVVSYATGRIVFENLRFPDGRSN